MDQPLILQKDVPYDPHPSARLPGIAPLDLTNWLIRDEAFDGQIALKTQLLDRRRADILGRVPGCEDAETELCAMIAQALQRQFGVSAQPRQLEDLVTLCQEDFVIMERRGDEHVMTAALVGFPASWTLAEKLGRPLTAIHGPVEEYDADIARRVQRLFDGVQPGRPLWRASHLWYAEHDLFQPRTEAEPRPDPGDDRPYFRSERQTVLRLPETGAAAFSIHTYVVPAERILPRLGA